MTRSADNLWLLAVPRKLEYILGASEASSLHISGTHFRIVAACSLILTVECRRLLQESWHQNAPAPSEVAENTAEA